MSIGRLVFVQMKPKLNFSVLDSPRHFWRKNMIVYDRKNTIQTVKHRGGSLMVWACFTSHNTGGLHIIDGKMDGAMYRQILKKSLIPESEAFI